MRKFLLTCLMFLGLGALAYAQDAAFEVDQVLESIQDGDIVAIYNKSDNQFLFGSDNQNLGYDVAEVAFKSTNNGWLFRVQEEEGHYLFHLQGRDGGDFNLWGSTENSYLNSQPADGWCSFILGLNNQWGQDGENLALWDIERDGDGYRLKNFGTGLYLNNALPARYSEAEAAVWTFCTLKEVVDEDVPQKSTKGIWVSVIKNGDFEGDDLSSFPLAKDGVNVEGAPYSPEIVVREDGGHCAKVVSDEGVTQTWSTQFFVKANEIIPEGTRYRMKFDIYADSDAEIYVGAHGEPRQWHAGGFAENFYATTSWETIDFGEGEITSSFAGSDGFRSVAFDLNSDMDVANTFYFDNFVFEIFKPSTAAEYNPEAVEVIFPFDTNIPALVSASGKSRLLLPTDCFTVKVNGKEAPISTVELTDKGRLYVFLDEDWAVENPMGEKDEVIVTFKNPADETYRIVYTEGNNSGMAVEDFVIQAEYNGEIDALPSGYTEPELVSANPEDGSFNLPNGIKEFKLTFDKTVICKKIKAFLGKEALTVSPADGFSKEITLTRTGTGDLATGAHTISVENIIGEKNLGEDYTTSLQYTIYVGKVDINPADQPEDVVPVSFFDDCADNSIPEGFQVVFNDVTRSAGETYSDGPRMRGFSNCADFGKALYFTKGYVEYGSVEGSELKLTAGVPYRVEFNSAMWKVSGKWMKFQVLDAKGEALVMELIKNSPNMDEKTDASVSGTTFSTFKFVVPETGNYKLRWTACDKDGNQGNYEVLLAKVHVYNIPATPGWEEVTKLQNAIALAQETIAIAEGDRYAGEAYNALETALKKYDAEAAGYTAPSSYNNAIADLTAKTATLSAHRSLCDKYDELRQRSLDDAANYAETKFAASGIFTRLQAAVAKYGDKVLTNDEEMATANAELDDIANLVKLMFTEGKSTLYDYWNSSKPGSGYMVLTDRLRQGVETLVELGVDEEDELILAANNALSDDDALADRIKDRIKLELYGKLKDADNDLFASTIDDDGNEISTGYNMSVFVKNPNIYVLDKSKDYTEENVPGWTVPTSGKPGLFDSWGGRNLKEIPQDVAFSAWKTAARMEQTVDDLPAGVYSVCFGAGSWNGSAEWIEGSFCYIKTSETLVPEEGEEEDRDLHFAATRDFEEGQVGPEVENNLIIENVIVVDGQLTFGVQFGREDQPFFNMVRLLMTAPADFNYAEAYTSVETAKTAKMRAVELYDLNGRRVSSARKGLVIVKKLMSDGSVKTGKVVK